MSINIKYIGISKVNQIRMSFKAIYSVNVCPPCILSLLFVRWFFVRKHKWVGYLLKHQSPVLMAPKRQARGVTKGKNG